jgi:hypothetical protein
MKGRETLKDRSFRGGRFATSNLEESVVTMRKEIVCPVCGKTFLLPTQNVYKHRKKGTDVCSYSCVLKSSGRDERPNPPERCRNCVFLNSENICAVTCQRKYRKGVCSYFLERT